MLYMSLVLSLLYWLSSPPLSALTTLPMPLKAKTKKYRLSAVSHTILIVAILFAISAHINRLTYCPIQLNCECDAYRFAFRIKWYATTKYRSSYPYFFCFTARSTPAVGGRHPWTRSHWSAFDWGVELEFEWGSMAGSENIEWLLAVVREVRSTLSIHD